MDNGYRHTTYTAAQTMITGGKLKAFKDLFEIVPKTVMAEDLGQNYRTFSRKR